jgi:tetratricopeptide (TPR) repeat protein
MQSKESVIKIKEQIAELDKNAYKFYMKADHASCFNEPRKTVVHFLNNALSLYEQEKDLILEIGQDPEDLCSSLDELIDILISYYHEEKAEKCYLIQISILNKLIEQDIDINKYKNRLAEAYHSLADLYSHGGYVSLAKENYNKQIELLTEKSCS